MVGSDGRWGEPVTPRKPGRSLPSQALVILMDKQEQREAEREREAGFKEWEGKAVFKNQI